jgi:hypothetical protein
MVGAINIELRFFHTKNIIHSVSQMFFDTVYYTTNYPEIEYGEYKTPFEHFINVGWKEGKNPRRDFDSNFYEATNRVYNSHYHFELDPLSDFVRYLMLFKVKATYPKKIIPLNNPRYYLALTAIFRNEARFLTEWIEYYILQGVEHFYLYNHLSEDNYQEVLQPYIESGIVDLYHIDNVPTSLKDWLENIQTKTYRDTIKTVSDYVEWLIICDTDEFFVPISKYKLSDFLKDYDDVAALSANWQLFGTNNIIRIQPNELMIEKITKSSSFEYRKNDKFVKTIAKPRYIENIKDPHFPLLKFGYAQVNENKQYFFGSLSPSISMNLIKVNHYHNRDRDFFEQEKLRRRVYDPLLLLTKEQQEELLREYIKVDKELSTTDDLAIAKYFREIHNKILQNKQNQLHQ